METKTTLSYETLARQAAIIAMGSTDEQNHYVQRHPELVTAFAQVLASDYNMQVIVTAIRQSAGEIVQAIQNGRSSGATNENRVHDLEIALRALLAFEQEDEDGSSILRDLRASDYRAAVERAEALLRG